MRAGGVRQSNPIPAQAVEEARLVSREQQLENTLRFLTRAGREYLSANPAEGERFDAKKRMLSSCVEVADRVLRLPSTGACPGPFDQ